MPRVAIPTAKQVKRALSGAALLFFLLLASCMGVGFLLGSRYG